ncbi:MAG: type II secretion system minor pseudopilin GspJ [Gammaproteobacteria bacterium]|nr:type II secretion system minor pseudopilin GspJ [Gammaproteobacteria bacterium]
MLNCFKARGFTLMEIIVVLAVFALIGVISGRIISGVLDNQRLLADRGDRLADVQLAMKILQRDVMQLNARRIRDQLGDSTEPLMIGADGMMEFTRAGWRNPLQQPRSELQRVGYIVQDDDLYRAYWSVLDRPPDAEPHLQKLLSGVNQIEFFALDVSGNEHSFWPLLGDYATDPNTALAGIIMRLEIEPFGVVERVWAVPSI